MKMKYDLEYNIAYISFRNDSEQVETLEISDELNVDITSDGKIYGIELLNAREQMKGDDGLFIYLNEVLGLSSKIELGLEIK